MRKMRERRRRKRGKMGRIFFVIIFCALWEKAAKRK